MNFAILVCLYIPLLRLPEKKMYFLSIGKKLAGNKSIDIHAKNTEKSEDETLVSEMIQEQSYPIR